FVEHLEAGLCYTNGLSVVRLGEVPADVCLAWHRRETAADHDFEAANLAAILALDLRDETHVVEWRACTIGRTAGECSLPLARQILADRVAQHVAGIGREVGRDVKQLVAVARNAGVGTAGNIANGVATRFAGGQSGVEQDLKDLGRAVEVHEMDMEVLAR